MTNTTLPFYKRKNDQDIEYFFLFIGDLKIISGFKYVFHFD